MSAFTLTKWYLDCVDEAGELTIVYWARIAWNRVALTAFSVLSGGREGVCSTTTVAGVPPPQFADGVLRFEANDLLFQMRCRTPSFVRTLIRADDGAIDWNCGIPSGDASVRRDGRLRRGLGYAESVQMSLAPWKLPIDELRWGRFTSDAVSLVWIDWRGAQPLTLALHDGVAVADASVTDSQVRAGDLVVDLSEERVVRDAHLGATLRAIPAVRRILPERLLEASEKKWCNRSTIRRGSDVVAGGWTVHERVRFR